METLAGDGLNISYKWVEEIESLITKKLCFKYNEDGIVFPPALEYGLFTTAAVDNIDQNPSFTGARSLFHGTSMTTCKFRKTYEIIFQVRQKCFRL